MKRIALFTAILMIALLALSGPSAQAGQSAPTKAATMAATGAATSDPLGGATTFAKANAPTHVNVMLDYTPNTNHLGIYVAQALGYYQDAALTVDIQQPGDVQVEQIVATGKAEFGVSYEEQATYSRAANVPIVSLAAVIQHNTSGFAALHDKHPLKSPADLAGLRYGAFGSPVEKPIISILMQCAGSKSVDTVEFDDIGFAEPFPLMEQNRIDFVWLFYAWDGIRAKQQGLNLDFLMLHDYVQCIPDYYTPLLITNEDMIKNHPDVVSAWTQATARGYAYAIQHPDEAAAILLKADPDLDANLVKESAVWLAPQFQAEASQWGIQKTEVWQGFTDFLVKNGALQSTIDVKSAFTNDFLPNGGNK